MHCRRYGCHGFCGGPGLVEAGDGARGLIRRLWQCQLGHLGLFAGEPLSRLVLRLCGAVKRCSKMCGLTDADGVLGSSTYSQL